MSLLSLCLLPLCIASCSKEKKKDSDESKATTEDTASTSDKAAKAETIADRVPAGNAGSGALAYLPKECAISFHVDIRSGMKNSALASTILPKIKAAFEEAQKEEKDLAAFVSATGVDPFGDFHELGGCLTTVPKDDDDFHGMGVVTGSAKPGLLAAMVATSKESAEFKPIAIAGAKGIQRDGIYIVQLDNGALLFGNDKAQLETSLKKPNGQAKHFAEIAKGTLRIVVPSSTAKMGFALPDSPFANFTDKIDGTSGFTADLDSRTMTLRIGTGSNETAIELAGAAKMLLSQVPKVQGESVEAQATAALAAAHVKGDGKAMVGTVRFDQVTLQKSLEEIASDM